MLLSRVLYPLFVGLMAFSPLLGLMVADLFGWPEAKWGYLWIGVGLSLPISLLGARLAGSQAYQDYWAYLESFPNHTRRGTVAAWLTALVGTLLLAVVAA